MFPRHKNFGLALTTMVALLLLAACGDNTATSTPPAATATTRPTTSAATAAPATTAVTTAARTTVPATVAATTAAATTNAATTGTSSTTAVALDPQKVEAGRKVFATQCTGCHLQEGKAGGGLGPNLAKSQNALNPDYVRGNVRNGRGQMIAFDKSEVSDADLENIILYLKSIHQS